jgi:nitric oxide reductase large subunit
MPRLGSSVVTGIDGVVDLGVDDGALWAAVIADVVITFVVTGVVAVVSAFVVTGVVAVVFAFLVTGVDAVGVAVVVGAMPTLKAISMATLSSSALMYASLYVAPREGHTLFCAKGNDALAQHSS